MLNFEGCREKDGSGYPFVFFFRKQKIVADSLTRRARHKNYQLINKRHL